MHIRQSRSTGQFDFYPGDTVEKYNLAHDHASSYGAFLGT